MKSLRIAKDLTLPLDAVTQTIAIIAKRRAGKSYTMRRLVEQLFKADQQIVLVDPKGDQHGIRSSADGKAPGLPIVILGGERGDVPLEPSSGEVVAKLVVEDRVSVLLDLSTFRKHEVATFMTSFMENLYRLKAREIYRTPMMLVVDEADAIAPQKPQKGEERMLGAAEDIVRRGGQRGIGCVLVTQRSAVLNKNVLTQAQMLIALRTIAPQDLAAMNAWIDVHGTPEQRKTLMESLPSLPIGDAWFWSPGWPTAEGIFKRTHVLPIETFDSGKSPEPGVKPVEPKNLADVDLDALKGQMAATIEKAKADDPKRLKARIAEFERAAKKPQAAEGPTPAWRAEYEEAHARDMAAARAAGLQEGLRKALPRLRQASAALGEATRSLDAAMAEAEREPAPAAVYVKRHTSGVRPRTNGSGRQSGHVPVEGVSRSQQRILDSLESLEGMGIAQPSKEQVALWAEVSPTSGGYFNNLGTLRSAGLIEYPSGGLVRLTEAGRKAAQASEPMSVEEMQESLCRKIGASKAAIVRALIEIYPKSIAKDDLAGKIGVSPTSGGYFNNLGSLRTLGVIDYPTPGQAVALPVLFLEA
jgi:hypothetical protein